MRTAEEQKELLVKARSLITPEKLEDILSNKEFAWISPSDKITIRFALCTSDDDGEAIDYYSYQDTMVRDEIMDISELVVNETIK